MSTFGRKIPPDWEHISNYPLRALLDDPSHKLVVPPANTEKSLGLPWWWKQHNQRQRSSCVGHGESAERSITNHYQRLKQSAQDITYRYDSNWLYDEALKVDEWPGEADEGTSLRAGYSVQVAQGHRRVQRGKSGPPVSEHGVSAYRWATSTDEIRAAIYAGLAVAIGVNWYGSFSAPYQKMPGGDYWIDFGQGSSILGGHCVCLFRMSDRRQAFKIMNSWGAYWQPSWVHYTVMERLLDEDGEAAVVVDR